MLSRPLIILDRDGVLNRMVVDAENGTIDSPLHPSQVEIFPWVPEALRKLRSAGFDLAVATNQPAAAKGKTTHANLLAVHHQVLKLAQASDLMATSHICYHRAEDGCACRKPRTGLLDRALENRSPAGRERSWMVGDGITDVEAGLAAGLQTAFLAPRKCSACRVLDDAQLHPNFWGTTLMEFTRFVVSRFGSAEQEDWIEQPG